MRNQAGDTGLGQRLAETPAAAVATATVAATTAIATPTVAFATGSQAVDAGACRVGLAAGLDGLAVGQVQSRKLRGFERVDVARQLVTITWATVAVLIAVGITLTALAALTLATLTFRAGTTGMLRTVLAVALPIAMAA